MTVDDVLDRLRAQIDERGSAFAWAHAEGVSPSYVSDVLSKRREPGPAILRALGLQSTTVYEEAGK